MYAYSHGDDLRGATKAGYQAGRDLLVGIFAAVADKIHETHLAGQERNINKHLTWLAGNGPPGKDPRKWGPKWKKDIAKALRIMRDRLERLKSDADEAKWQDRIDKLQQRADEAK